MILAVNPHHPPDISWIAYPLVIIVVVAVVLLLLLTYGRGGSGCRDE
jgi:hypothetical protein